eukprot:COSAG01_NODE_2487_length_7592_cov_4.423328_13_plen_94_part_00
MCSQSALLAWKTHGATQPPGQRQAADGRCLNVPLCLHDVTLPGLLLRPAPARCCHASARCLPVKGKGSTRISRLETENYSTRWLQPIHVRMTN